jgi:radical SAM protein with 4Fe4S-binding SPASM domain
MKNKDLNRFIFQMAIKKILSKKKEFPLFQSVMLELTSTCNRNCDFCPRKRDRSGNRKDKKGRIIRKKLPTNKVMDLFDQLEKIGFTGGITFHHLSEAFLDKRLIKFAKEARRRGMIPYINTNGDVLRNNENLRKEAIKYFDSFLIGLYDYKTTKERDEQIKFWIKVLRGAKVSFSCIEKRFPRHGITKSLSYSKKKMNIISNKRCGELIRRLIIHYDGNVAFCCEDMTNEFNLGNVYDKSIKDIWFSKKHIKMIRDLEKMGGRKLYSLCKNCPVDASNTRVALISYNI